jgi:hypothetical protein
MRRGASYKKNPAPSASGDAPVRASSPENHCAAKALIAVDLIRQQPIGKPLYGEHCVSSIKPPQFAILRRRSAPAG